MDVYGFLRLFVDGWPKKGSYIQHLLAASDSLESLPLSNLARRPHRVGPM